MDPRHDPDLILGHLEGDLSPEDAAKVQALREADPDFAALLDGMADDRSQLRTAPAAEPPAGLVDVALADLERSMLLDDADDGIAMLPPRRRRFPIAPLLTYGGIAAVLALTASAVLKSVQPPASSPPIAATPSTEGFDIAAAPIEAQRELARRDRADVGFGADEAPGQKTAEARIEALATGDTTDTNTHRRLERPFLFKADETPVPTKAAAPSTDGFVNAPTQLPLALADAEALVESVDASPPPVAANTQRGSLALGRNAGAAAANQGLNVKDAVAVASSSPSAVSPPPSKAHTGPTQSVDGMQREVIAQTPPPALISKQIFSEPAAEAEAKTAATSAAAWPAGLREVKNLGDDWMRWTTLSGDMFDAGPPPRP